MYAFVQVVKASALGRKVSVYSDTSNMKSVMSFRASFAPEMTVCPAVRLSTRHFRGLPMLWTQGPAMGVQLSSDSFLGGTSPYMSQLLGLNIKISKQKCHVKSPVRIVTSCKQQSKLLWHTVFLSSRTIENILHLFSVCWNF